MNIALAKQFIGKSLGRTGLILSKYSPEILIGVGVVGVVASTVMACKATLKVECVVKDAQEKIDKIHAVHNDESISKETYSDEDFKKDLVIVHVQKVVALAKLYAPAAVLGAVSVGCILGSHSIMAKRNLGLVAAYKLLDEAFIKYRKRVAEDLGEETDKMYRLGIYQEKVSVLDTSPEEGPVVFETNKNVVRSESVASPYAVWFDENSTQWQKNPMYNEYFLRAQQNYVNDLLKAQGHVFLNEVHDRLGLPRTSAGQAVGWIYGRGTGDDYIDFDIYNPSNEDRFDFTNGESRAVLLDFNVDGTIWDKI